MPSTKGRKVVATKFDSEFRFLVDLDPELEGWRTWAAEYWAGLPKTDPLTQSSLIAFLVTYLHGQGLHTLPPEELFARDGAIPAPDATLGLTLLSKVSASQKHDIVSDFLALDTARKAFRARRRWLPRGTSPPRQPLPEAAQ
ncbi:hypothetical protein QF022_002743 [Vogesella perlucida]|nr:hypothetical protein [Vogesella perlucida]